MTDEVVLASRRSHIGGSDIGAIIGVDRWRTPYDVWLEKTGQAPPFEGNADTRRGLALEPVAARHYTERTAIKLQQMHSRLTHPEHPFLAAQVDRVTVGLDKREIREIKCPRLGGFMRAKREGIDKSYIAQLQWQLGLANFKMIVPRGAWIIFCADAWDALDVPVEYDAPLALSMYERALHFWHEHVLKGVPPSQEQADEFRMEIEQAGGMANLVRRDDEPFVDAMALLQEAKALKAEAETIEEEAKGRVLALIEEKPGLYLAPGARLSVSMAKGRTSFDKDMLRASKPLDALLVAGEMMKLGLSASVLMAALPECALDLSRFEKTGKPYRIVKPTFFGGDA